MVPTGTALDTAPGHPWPVVLETDRLVVRHWVADDWRRLRPLATDPAVRRCRRRTRGTIRPWCPPTPPELAASGFP